MAAASFDARLDQRIPVGTCSWPFHRCTGAVVARCCGSSQEHTFDQAEVWLVVVYLVAGVDG